MAFAPIHNHSEYSALDGLSTCREIAERCQVIGCECCGLSDHNTVAGHLEFGKTMAEFGIKPVYACELYHGTKTEFAKQERDQAHFVAGALTDEGLRNLWRLVSASSTNFRFVGRVNWQFLEQHREGLFATSACIQGLISRGVLRDGDPYEPLNRYLELFGDNFYIELHTYPGEEHELLNQALVQIGTERGIPFIYATDAHFASPEQYEVHDAFVAMQTGENIYLDPADRKMWHPKSLYIQSEDEIHRSLAYLPKSVVDEALVNSAELAERCNAQLPEIKRHLPLFVPDKCPWLSDKEKDVDAADLFVELVRDGLQKRYGKLTDVVLDRATQELEVFLDAGLEHYFLQAWDFCQFCDRNKIKRGPGRGSAGGAIVSYALGITDIDPLQYGLIFERFYNAGREKGFPDIDNDFPVKERKRVREYLIERWGKDKVRTIGTITRLKPKAALDRTYKACGVTWEEKEALKKIVNNVPDIDILGADSIGWGEEIDPGKTIYVLEHVGEAIQTWVSKQENDRRNYCQYWVEEVLPIDCSRNSGYGVHPSGVVVSDVGLDDELPCDLRGPAKDKVQATQFPMSDVDVRMFVKQDLLGLRNLDTLEDWEHQVHDKLGTIDWALLNKVPEWDEDMWKMLDHGLTLGIFQIEKGYARQLCKEFKPRSIEDLGIIISLNRPGPIRSGAPNSFITRRNGGEDDKFDGRKILQLADILEPTYGWFLYQEQVIAFFTKLGYDLSDADAVRKILGKKKPEAMRALRNGEGEWDGKGYAIMAKQAGLDAALADVIWNKLEDFAKYSFNKSHAIAYATIAFRTLFAKYHGTPEYIMACIRTNPDEAGDYVSEGRRVDIQVLPPDIARAEAEISVKNEEIVFGFSNVKGIGKSTAEYIGQLREQHEIYTPELLAKAVNFEQEVWEHQRDAAKHEGKAFKRKSPKQRLRANCIPLLYDAGCFDDFDERVLSLPERQKLEKNLLGVILSDDCEEIFERNAKELDECDKYPDLESNSTSKCYLPGIVATLVPKKTKKDGKAMGIVTIEYQGDEAEFVVFPREWKSYRFLWKERTPAIFGLTKTERGIRFEEAIKLT